jgi:DNA replication protein DnaC
MKTLPRVASEMALTGRLVPGSERLTGALLDRLTHHVHILQMNGESYRLNQSKSRSRRASSDTPADNPAQV